MKILHVAVKLMLFAILLSGCSTSSQQQTPSAAASEEAERQAMKSFERGQSDARKDIVKKKLVVVGWRVNPYGPAFAVLIHDKYGIELREMPTSTRNAITQQYVYGYNDAMSDEFQKRLGNDIFDRLSDEAKKFSEGNQTK